MSSDNTNFPENPTLLLELEEEIERQLEAKARKNNLTVNNVKNMIKAVITSQDVLTMMDANLNMTQDTVLYEPKLTRAKIRELMATKKSKNVWDIVSPNKKSDIAELINQELPDDSSDEEYHPQEDGSDEESKLEEFFFDDELTLPDELLNENIQHTSSEDHIGQRTRSKLCLSETPLEAIEQAFIPPDITNDMYMEECENEDWLDFLKEFTQPLNDTEHVENNDEENDPEYNVMVDEEHEGLDQEELRMDRAVKVSKKELNSLMSELYEYTNMLLSSDDEEKTTNNLNTDQNNDTFDKLKQNQMNENDFTDELFKEHEVIILQTQRELLEQQIRQHIQLVLTHLLLSYCHPFIEKTITKTFKKMLKFWNDNLIDPNNVISNIKSSIELLQQWENSVSSKTFKKELENFHKEQIINVNSHRKRKIFYKPEIPSQLVNMCKESTAFLYPLIMPICGFSDGYLARRTDLTPAEENLIIMGMLDFYSGFPEIEHNLEVNKKKLVQYVHSNSCPKLSAEKIKFYIQRSVYSKKPSAIKNFMLNNKVPEIKHYIISLPNKPLKLKHQPPELIHSRWK